MMYHSKPGVSVVVEVVLVVVRLLRRVNELVRSKTSHYSS